MSNLRLAIDEAQLSNVKEDTLWVTIKNQKSNSTGLNFVLLCSYGSASDHTLVIEGFAPIDLTPEYQVPLCPLNGETLSLSFTVDGFR